MPGETARSPARNQEVPPPPGLRGGVHLQEVPPGAGYPARLSAAPPPGKPKDAPRSRSSRRAELSEPGVTLRSRVQQEREAGPVQPLKSVWYTSMPQAVRLPPVRGAHGGAGVLVGTLGASTVKGPALPPPCGPLWPHRPMQTGRQRTVLAFLTSGLRPPERFAPRTGLLCVLRGRGPGVPPFPAPPRPGTSFLDPGPCPPGANMSVTLDWEPPAGPSGEVLEGFLAGPSVGDSWSGVAGAGSWLWVGQVCTHLALSTLHSAPCAQHPAGRVPHLPAFSERRQSGPGCTCVESAAVPCGAEAQWGR